MPKNEVDRLSANATRIDALPAVQDAVLDGTLSTGDAALIAGAGEMNPDAVDHLLDVARNNREDLRDECLSTRKNAETDAERAKRHHKNRFFRTWTGDDGLGSWSPRSEELRSCSLRLAARTLTKPSRRAVRFLRLRPQRQLQQSGRWRNPCSQRHSQQLFDVEALRRGDTLEGERCEIPGVGPVSAEWVRSILGDSALNLIITNGVDVLNVTHVGRRIPAEMMTALLCRKRRCSHPGCTRTGYLEGDHILEVARGGLTSLDNLQWLCPEHHRQKTKTFNRGRDKRTRKPTPTGARKAAKPPGTRRPAA